MNTASAPARTPETSNYINLWLNCLSAVLAEKIGAVVSCVALPASSNLPSISEDDTWITISASGQLKGELAFRLPLAFGQNVTSSPVGDVDTLLLEIFNLSAAGVQKRMESKCVVTHQAKKTPHLLGTHPQYRYCKLNLPIPPRSSSAWRTRCSRVCSLSSRHLQGYHPPSLALRS